MENRPDNDKPKNSFRLSDEARAEIDREYMDVPDDYSNYIRPRTVVPNNNFSNYREYNNDFEEYDDHPDRYADDSEEYDYPFDEYEDIQDGYEDVQDEYEDNPEDYSDDFDDFDDIPEEEYGEFPEVETPEGEEERPPKKKKKHWLRRLIVGVIVLCFTVIAVDIGLLFFSGHLWFNEPRKRDYPIRGPVITEKAGEVQWKRFAQQNIQICYIRATKGVSFEDKLFEQNKEGSGQSDLPTGMIHVFDPMRDGEEQAEHFIEVCGGMGGRLRPVVDCDLSVFYSVLPSDEEKVADSLRAFVDRIEEEYGCTPIIKCDADFYEDIASAELFNDCPIWYVSEYKKLPKDVRADLWGYSSRVKFSYYENHNFLEMVVLNGGEDDYYKLTMEDADEEEEAEVETDIEYTE
ncbi:glycoside hydrolase family 25 protein [Ruminococcus albus]|uniref:Glycosyl hydrolases family 25 n=1 Tax=Ruminococcus albus TaxID=1264 RepID=A0A1I1CY22_RUMAL|nr:GH25 family lysozyme [Ruminococcus albus]SFB66992.1 Glycosyl hydrolases family 25 [Ruminococcus albus]